MYNQDAYRGDNQPGFSQFNYGEATSHVQQVDAIKPQQPASVGWRDWPFAVLFLLNVAAIIALMGIWGFDALDSDTKGKESSPLLSSKNTKTVVIISAVLAVAALGIALAFVKLLVAFARPMITFCLWFNVFVSFAVAAYGFAIGSIVFGVLALIVALLNLCYARAVRNRIPFAAVNLQVAAAAISKHSTTYCISIALTIVQIVWVLVWAIAMVGVANQFKSDDPSQVSNRNGFGDGSSCASNFDCASNYCRMYSTGMRRCYGNEPQGQGFKSSGSASAAYFFLLLSLYWGLQVFKNISHTTVAGTVATFWYNSESSGASGASLKRACTTSLGSICMGSLLVAILQTLRSLAQNAREEGSCAACIAECILGCLEALMEYFNRWAFVYVGIYGYTFTKSGKAVLDLFRSRGFDAIINDDLIGNVLGFASLAVGMICAVVGVILSNAITALDFDNSSVVMGLLGLFIGIGIAMTPLSVIDSSVATIFVCFAEDPAAFMHSHPDLYQSLVAEWHAMYPGIMMQAGYWHA